MKGSKDDLALCISVLWLLMAAGCATVPQTKDYTAFRSANPRSILIVPPINRSPAVGAPAFVLTTLPIPVAERGYYVFPVGLVKGVLEDEGLADADFVHGSDPARLCGLFGADSVLYVTVEDWVVAMAGVDVSVNVELDGVSASKWRHAAAATTPSPAFSRMPCFEGCPRVGSSCRKCGR